MVKRNPSMEHDPSLEALNSEQSRGAAGDQSNMDRVVRESVEFIERTEWDRWDQIGTCTFLGCSMEMLRSSLAKWAERSNGGR